MRWGFFPLLIFHLPGALAGPAAAALSQEHTRFCVTWSHLYLSVCLCCRTEQFQESQWRRMKTPGEGTGETRLSLSSPVWAMLWAWAMSGGFHTSATEMEEVSITMTTWAHYLCIDKLNYSVPMFIIWYRHWFLWNIRSRIYYNCSINEVQICKRVAIVYRLHSFIYLFIFVHLNDDKLLHWNTRMKLWSWKEAYYVYIIYNLRMNSN